MAWGRLMADKINRQGMANFREASCANGGGNDR
jgi:hypothetical protein